MDQPIHPAKVLTIAGSDSGGAAGLQADLKTLTALGVYGMSVVTAVTAQNSLAVEAVFPLPADFVAAQLDAVLSDYGAQGIKTGFLARGELIQTIAQTLHRYPVSNLIVDPVLVNHKGDSMFPPAVTAAYIEHLLPFADLITPNQQEATLLSGLPVTNIDEAKTAVSRLHTLGPKNVLLKGIRVHNQLVDLFFDGAHLHHLPTPIIDTKNTHGSGDTLSAAICAYLALGEGMETAVRKAQQFTAVAIRNAADWQLGQGHGPLAQWTVINGQ
jgi:hydroxymethylpyrimidine kinase/phosphomethylpyrimidine kinase